MNPKDFTKQSPGNIVKTKTGYRAYIPDSLPPEINWTSGLLNKLSKADRSIAQLAEVGGNFPAPHVVVRPFIRQEAVLSSRIEGTQTSLQDLYIHESQQLSFFEDIDVQEVQNCVHALGYGLNRLEILPVSKRLIEELHAILLKGVRGEYATPGEIRKTQNWIGAPGASLNDATFVPPPVIAMHTCLSDLEKYIHTLSEMPALVRIALIHYQFEAIHPFIDGNGRVGRLLVSLLLSEWDLLPQPLLYLSAYFEKNRQAYYDNLLAVSQKGTWEEWLSFFLIGIDVQAKESTLRLKSLLALRNKYQNIFASERTRETLLKAVDYLIGNPIVSVKQLQEGIDLGSFVSAQRYIDKLVKLKVLQQHGKKSRNRLFVAKEIFSIIDSI